MFTEELTTSDERVRLIEPNVDRDAPLSVRWLEGSAGRNTMKLMGEADENSHGTTLEEEKERIAGFLTDDAELDWMVQFDGRVVGAIWVHLRAQDNIKAPAISLMIGDPSVRGNGVGAAASAAVLEWLKTVRHEPVVYARHLVENAASRELGAKFGVENDGEPYVDEHGLHWQNVRLVNRGR